MINFNLQCKSKKVSAQKFIGCSAVALLLILNTGCRGGEGGDKTNYDDGDGTQINVSISSSVTSTLFSFERASCVAIYPEKDLAKNNITVPGVRINFASTSRRLVVNYAYVVVDYDGSNKSGKLEVAKADGMESYNPVYFTAIDPVPNDYMVSGLYATICKMAVSGLKSPEELVGFPRQFNAKLYLEGYTYLTNPPDPLDLEEKPWNASLSFSVDNPN